MSYFDLRVCTSCGSKNRIPAVHLADTGRCGSCKATLPPLAAPLQVDGAAFHEIVNNSRVPVFVDFWASWCGPCRIAAPEVEALAREMAGQIVVLKIDTERETELAAALRIESIPTFVVFRNGQPVLRRSGVAPRREMRRWVEQIQAAA